MSLLWIEGFEGFGSTIGGAPSPTGIIGRKYPTIGGESAMDIEVGRYGDYCLELLDWNIFIQTPNLTTDSTLLLGVAFKLASIPATQRDLLYFYEGIIEGMQVRVNADGTLSVYNGSTHLSTSLSQISASTWYYLEFKVVTNNSSGTYELRVNSAIFTSGSGADTQPGSNAYHTSVRLIAPNGISCHYDDMYVLDGSGAVNNDFLGNRAVKVLRPDGAGADADWTPSTGSNYENVDEVELDEDTTYNETSTATDQDLFTYADASGVSSIDGIMVNTDVRVTTGSMDIQTVCKSDTTIDLDSAETITSQTYISKQYLLEEDPDASAAWTPTTLNAAQFGVKAS